MKNLKHWARGALAIGAVAGLVLLLSQTVGDTPATVGDRIGAQTIAGAGNLPEAGTPSAAVQADGRAGAQAPLTFDSALFSSTSDAHMPAAASPLSTMTPPRFAADQRGKLVLNSDTHANLEKLLLEENPETMRKNLEQISKGLPAQAAAELKVLVNQFQQYSKALTHSVSPENAPETEQEGLKLLDTLHTLRVSYLGADATEAMFGAEEATTRQLIALMASEKDSSLTPQQKAERAQEIMSSQRQPPAS